MANPAEFKDVHVYDGQYTHNITTHLSLQEKVILFNWLISYTKTIGDEYLEKIDMNGSTNGLKLVIENTQSQSNFDPINKVYADDILAEICEKLVSSDDKELRRDIIRNVLEQMDDMFKLGQCPQGKCTRLIQICKSF